MATVDKTNRTARNEFSIDIELHPIQQATWVTNWLHRGLDIDINTGRTHQWMKTWAKRKDLSSSRRLFMVFSLHSKQTLHSKQKRHIIMNESISVRECTQAVTTILSIHQTSNQTKISLKLSFNFRLTTICFLKGKAECRIYSFSSRWNKLKRTKDAMMF